MWENLISGGMPEERSLSLIMGPMDLDGLEIHRELNDSVFFQLGYGGCCG